MPRRFFLTPMLLLPLFSAAHDGHGLFSGSPLVHYLAEPPHLPLILSLVILIWLGKKAVKRNPPPADA